MPTASTSGLIASDRLYLKANDLTRAIFEAAGCEPFVYEAGRKKVTLSYWTAPAEASESPPQMHPWACLAIAAALRAKAAKPPSTARKPAATPSALKATAPKTPAAMLRIKAVKRSD